MIDRNHRLALTKQSALLGISRCSVYYEPVPVSAADLALMRRLDELHIEFPFAGTRMLCGLLAALGIVKILILHSEPISSSIDHCHPSCVSIGKRPTVQSTRL